MEDHMHSSPFIINRKGYMTALDSVKRRVFYRKNSPLSAGFRARPSDAVMGAA
jgi:hypothetical protein